MATLALMEKGSAGRTCDRGVRMLLVDGKIGEAEQLAKQTPDEVGRSVAMNRIAVAKAQRGDTDGAIAALQQALGGRRSVIAVMARNKNDEGARRVIASLPAHQQDDAWVALAQAQLDRDDLPAAVATVAPLTGNSAYYLRTALAVAQARVGKTQEAVAAAFQDGLNRDLAIEVFDAMLKYGRLDAAADLLAKIPRPEQDPRSEDLRGWLAPWLATALADANRIGDAERVLASARARADRPEDADNARQAAWAIAAARRRTGDAAGYEAARKPLLEVVRTAAGAPSWVQAQRQLLAFYVATDDFAPAEALLTELDPRLYWEAMMGLAMEARAGPHSGGRVARPVILARDPRGSASGAVGVHRFVEGGHPGDTGSQTRRAKQTHGLARLDKVAADTSGSG